MLATPPTAPNGAANGLSNGQAAVDVTQTLLQTGAYSTNGATALSPTATATTGEPAAQNAAAEMLKKTVLLQLETGRVGTSRSVSTEVIDSQADPSSVYAGKRLLSATFQDPETGKTIANPIKAISKLDGEIRKYVRSKCPPTMVKKSVFFVPIVKVNDVEKKLRQFAAARANLVDVAAEALPGLIEHDQQQLADLFNPSDYPTVAQFRALYHFAWNYTTFGVPDVLSAINEDIFEQEKGKQAALWNEAHEMTQQLTRVRALGLAEKMHEALKPGADGKKKIFRNTLFTNIQEFLDDFDAFNITSDAQLAQAVETMRNLLSGVDINEVRKSDDVRSQLAESFAGIEETLTAMVTEKPIRAISFEEDV